MSILFHLAGCSRRYFRAWSIGHFRFVKTKALRPSRSKPVALILVEDRVRALNAGADDFVTVRRCGNAGPRSRDPSAPHSSRTRRPSLRRTSGEPRLIRSAVLGALSTSALKNMPCWTTFSATPAGPFPSPPSSKKSGVCIPTASPTSSTFHQLSAPQD
jgi:hypothetical protein